MIDVQNMSEEEFQELAAAVLNRMGQEPYTINKGIFELVDTNSLVDVHTNLGQYKDYDEGW